MVNGIKNLQGQESLYIHIKLMVYIIEYSLKKRNFSTLMQSLYLMESWKALVSDMPDLKQPVINDISKLINYTGPTEPQEKKGSNKLLFRLRSY